MCAEVEKYFIVQREHPDLAIPGPKASLAKSWECCCRICSVGCRVVEYDGDLQTDNAKNQSAAARNSTLPFFQSEDRTEKRDKLFEAEFRGSGLVFERPGFGEEVFVVDST